MQGHVAASGVSLVQSTEIHGIDNCTIPGGHCEVFIGSIGVLWHLQVQHVWTRSFNHGSWNQWCAQTWLWESVQVPMY